MGNCTGGSLDRTRFKGRAVWTRKAMIEKRAKGKGKRTLRVFPREEDTEKSFEVCRCETERMKQTTGVAAAPNTMEKQNAVCQKEKICSGDIKRSQSRSGGFFNPGMDVSLYIVTWNMNSKVAGHDLDTLLGGKRTSFDFYVVGLQEAPSDNIAASIQKALGRNYILVSAAIMQSLRLYIFGRESWKPFIRDVRVDKIKGGGLGGVVGRQKGAVAISINLIHTSFMIISCHLAPHENNVEERNSQYQRISQSIFSDSNRGSMQPTACLSSPSRLMKNLRQKPDSKPVPLSSLETSDVVIWLGDLNYRIEGSRRSVGVLINQNLQQLWERDQLFREAGKGEIFHGFCEGPLSFPPTYKYDIGTNEYDTSTKKRVPSWTDRILYKINSGNVKAHVEDYDCVDSVKGSDHRPVKAHLRVKFRRPLVNRLQRTTNCSCMY